MGSMGQKDRSLIIRGKWRCIPYKTISFADTVCRLEAIRKQAAGRVRIVLHGTNGFADEITQRCIAAGVSKINVNKLVLDDYNTHLKGSASRLPQTQLIDEGIQSVIRLQANQMNVSGSTGRAPTQK
jgi:fructose-bisphosphate aldolase class II